MDPFDAQGRVEAVRRFNRFYTKRIGVLREGLLESPFSLTEARIIYELANQWETTAARLSRELELDPGYLSRILRRFERTGLIARQPSGEDGRQSLLRLTEKGDAAFAELNQRSRNEIGAMLGALTGSERDRLVAAMATIEAVLGDGRTRRAPYLIRPHQPGDMGWVVHRHGVLYAEEYGWDETFEALVARIVADFVDKFDPRAARCWMAEREGEIIGSAFVVRKSKTVAQLRLVLVEPSARGLGVGSRLVEECIRFARRAGYRKMILWTNSILTAAARVYDKAGFRLVREEPHRSFGHDLVGQFYELPLKPGPARGRG